MPIPGPSDGLSGIVTLAQVKDTLNMDQDDDSQDDELQILIDGITAVIEGLIGPVVSSDWDEFYDGGKHRIFLNHYPILAVTSVTQYSPTAQVLAYEPWGTDPFTGYGYRIEKNSQLIRTSGGTPSMFPHGTGNIEVVYIAGRVAVPPNVVTATLDLIRIHWAPQRSVGPSTLGAGDTNDYSSGTQILGFFVPYQVMEQLSSERHVLA